ncbi:MAG: PorV/PorQ family protein [Bacteroidota bacterium]
MNKYSTILFFLCCSFSLFAGNPDRQGEAGAAELLMNPWARSAGLHSMNTANVFGVEAMRLNIAGISRINQTDINVSRALYLRGTDINMNAFGLVQKVGKNGAIGISLMALDFGDIPVTTTNQPEGTGATFSPNFFNLGLGYSHTFENKVSVGILFRAVSESTQELSALGFALDAGVQYVAGEQEEFKFGISLRNIGTPMRYSGQGLALPAPSPDSDIDYTLTLDQRSEDFELPSVLNIGASYDINIGEINRVTVLGNFTANSFSQDQLGAGVEYSLNDLFQMRAAYKYEVGSENVETAPIYSGLSVGASLAAPLSKENKNRIFGIDYAYRQTRLFDGTHNISVRISL